MADHATKFCSACQALKPVEAFSPDARRRDGRQTPCKTCKAAKKRDAYRENSVEVRRKSREAYQANREVQQARIRRAKRASYQRAREQVFDHYGTKCCCCGVTDRLSIDHIAGNGREHRAEIYPSLANVTGGPFYAWLVRNGFPSGFQTLCLSCNSSKKRGDRCRLDHD